MQLRLDTTAREIQADRRKLIVTRADDGEEAISYDALVVGTGAVPVRPPIEGLTGPDALGSTDGVHLLHSMCDTFELMRTLEKGPRSAVIVGAGYIGLEMAEGLSARGIRVTQLEQLPEVLPTVDTDLGTLVHRELETHGVEIHCTTAMKAVARAQASSEGRLRVDAIGAEGPETHFADVVLVVVGVRPDTELASSAGASVGPKGAIAVDRSMRTNLPKVFAAGDCVVTYHRLLPCRRLPTFVGGLIATLAQAASKA